ncbi:MAG TPA: glycosyltransferase family 2 protein [bacterium]|nr:glycosyltransferase family 2 protein [bacterium]
MDAIDLTLVIPCYNDGPHLEESLREIERVLSQTRYTYEMILIDDGSPDGSAEKVKEAAARRGNVRALYHARNVGRGGTVAEGMKLARGTFAGYLDIDLEVHARYIPSMLLALENGFDGATALRHYEIRLSLDTFYRHILSTGYRKLVHFFLRLPYRDTEAGYKFFRRERILPLLEKTRNTGWFWDTEIMAQCHYHGLRIQEIPVLFLRRWDKKSTVRPLRDSVVYLIELLPFRARVKKELSKEKSL